ncbi:MAG: sugar-binding domain-containing protein, partial [Bacteroidales bacterium]
MKWTTPISLLFLVLLALAGSTLTNCTRTDYGDWAQQKAPLMTKWSADAMPGKAWTEYPRPQMERKNWKNLNGLWDYAITPVESQKPETWAGKILVPYPVESALSGVMKTLAEGEKLWYHRELKSPVRMKTERVLIHFEAVDWLTRVYIDDQLVGEHQGGYDPFSFDL